MSFLPESGIVNLVRSGTQNNPCVAQLRVRLPGMAGVRLWMLHTLALFIAVELGVLSPLNCVIHCLVQRILAERPAIALFLCHHDGRRDAPAGMTESTAPAMAPDAVSNLAPRALYELLHQIVPLLVIISLMMAVLAPRPLQEFPAQTVPPPTPPPRW